MRRRNLLIAGAIFLSLAALPLHGASGAEKPKPKILYFTRSSGWAHPVTDRQGQPLAFSEKILTALGEKHGLEVVCSQDNTVFDGDLHEYDLMVMYTSGNPFEGRQMQNLIDAVAAGKPLVGIHATTDTYASPEIDPYLALLGGSFVSHGEQQKARQRVTSPKFPGVEKLGDGFELEEEWYLLRGFAKDLHVILLQETKGMTGEMYQRSPYPATWARRHGKGRVFYTDLGHREDVWENPTFQNILLGGISWALGQVDVDIAPNIVALMPEG